LYFTIFSVACVYLNSKFRIIASLRTQYCGLGGFADDDDAKISHRLCREIPACISFITALVCL